MPADPTLDFRMSRLRAELARLYGPDPTQPQATGLLDAQGRSRALVVELAAPADWAPLQAAWQGVQADLGFPAPAIAVSGTDGLQLWFSAPEPVAAADAQRWLQGLAQRYLGGVAPRRLRLFPRPVAAGADVRHVQPVPAEQPVGGQWSAFVAPDLVPIFADTPWLDIAPSDDGQATLLARVGVMKAGWFEALVNAEAKAPVPAPTNAAPAPGSAAGAAVVDDRGAPAASPAGVALTALHAAAAAFLQRVMNDEAAPLALRVDAAKALLQAGRGG